MRTVLLFLFFSCLASPWVIYKRNHKRKLICKEEHEWTNSTSFSEDSVESSESPRTRRDIVVDPEFKQPVIFLGTKPNDSVFIDDGDFDVVSEHLTKAELEQVKKRIMDTCNALNADNN